MARMEGFQSSPYGIAGLQYPPHLHPESGAFPAPALTAYGDRTSEFFNYDNSLPSTELTDRFQEGREMGAGNRGRLTREEVADLEQELAAKTKVKSSHKSDLAQKFRQMVKTNGRRSKSKHRKLGSKDLDASSHENNILNPQRSFSPGEMDGRIPPGFPAYSKNQRPSRTDVDGFDFGVGGGPVGGFDFELDATPSIASSHDNDYLYAASIAPSANRNVHDSSVPWTSDDLSMNSLVTQPNSGSPFVHHPSRNHSPQSSNGVPPYEAHYDQLRKGSDPSQMYPSNLVGSGSLLPYESTTASSDADLSQFLPPSAEAHALPWMHDEQHSRRTSDSSELANNFASNCQVQQHQNVGLSGPGFRASETTLPVLTPDDSPSQSSTALVAPGRDLASRRKGQKPAPLRPGSGSRSQSYGSMPSMSPRVRTPSNPLRTSQSQTVLNGRVSKPSSKPGSNHASPRHHSTTFELRPTRDLHHVNIPDSGSPAISRFDTAPFSQTIDNLQPEEPWPSQHSGLAGPQFYANQSAYSSVPDLNAQAFLPLSKISTHPHERAHHLAPDYHSPQSAPPYQTTFQLHEPSSAQSERAPPVAWVPSQTFPVDYDYDPTIMPHTGLGPHADLNAGYQPIFAPKTHMGILPAASLGSSSEQLLDFTPVTKSPSTEFKTERETKPDQIFIKTTTRDFNFANSTVKDFDNKRK